MCLWRKKGKNDGKTGEGKGGNIGVDRDDDDEEEERRMKWLAQRRPGKDARKKL